MLCGSTLNKTTEMETKTVQKIDVSQFTPEQLKEMYEEARKKERNEKNRATEAYEGIRAEVVHNIFRKVEAVTSDVEALHTYVQEETEAFKEVMADYGKLRKGGQLNFQIQDGNLRVRVTSQRVKNFDERADIAAARLIEFLQAWIEKTDKGADDPMYQLGMLMLERNKQGDLDYKNISKLYQMEAKFNDATYSEIMDLFRESHTVESNAVKFYFDKKDKNEVWQRIEPSFNRL